MLYVSAFVVGSDLSLLGLFSYDDINVQGSSPPYRQPDPLCFKLTSSAMLRPMTLLSNGAPKQDPIAISGFPDLATTVSATKSATELPMASTVSPKIAVFIEMK